MTTYIYVCDDCDLYWWKEELVDGKCPGCGGSVTKRKHSD